MRKKLIGVLSLSLCNYQLSRGVYYSIQYNGPRPDCTCAYHTVSTVFDTATNEPYMFEPIQCKTMDQF